MLIEVTEKYTNVEVNLFDGLLIDFLRQNNATLIIRGLRAVSDFEYELQIAQTNHNLDKNIDTIFFVTDVEYSYLSSSIVKEVAKYGKSVEQFVPLCVAEKLKTKYNNLKL